MRNQYKSWLKGTLRSDMLVKKRILDILIKSSKLKNKRVIDFGCGNGDVARELASKGAKVTGMDSSKEQLKLASNMEKNRPLGIKYILRDISKEITTKRKKYDIALSMMVALHLTEKEIKVHLKNVSKSLRKSGLFIYGNIHPFRILSKEKSRWMKSKYVLEKSNYFESQEIKSILFDENGNSKELTYYHHRFEFIINEMIKNNLEIIKIIEPKPTASEKNKYNKLILNEDKVPSYLIIVCRRK